MNLINNEMNIIFIQTPSKYLYLQGSDLGYYVIYYVTQKYSKKCSANFYKFPEKPLISLQN